MEAIYDQYMEFWKMCDAGDYQSAESLLKDIIIKAVSTDDVELCIKRTDSPTVYDYIGQIKNGANIENIAVALKISQHELRLDKISSLLVKAMADDVNNIILISNNDLTSQVEEIAAIFSKKAGLNFQVFGRNDLNTWLNTYNKPNADNSFISSNSVHMVMKEMSRKLVRTVAMHPEEFMDLEWRILEHIIAAVFSDFGYSVDLTPSSKDGGKDVIVWHRGESYIVEIKHWKEKSKVGQRYISNFVKVVIKENRKSGLYLSSSGYTANAFEILSKIEKTKIRYGDRESMQTLMKMYERVNNGIYIPVNDLEYILGEISDTVE